ncbi:MAG: SDR family oxidoreductase [Pseudomonadales bacterium]|nr:SDR family oxidoreductase [Pseudomonadales bacterium]
MELKNKVIAITGAARGIGRAIAIRLAEQGANIAAIDLDLENLTETVSLVEKLGVKAKSYQCDVADEAMVETTFASIVEQFGSIEGLVNNAGVLRDGLLIKVSGGKVIKKMTAQQYDLVVNVHMKGAFLCTREAAAQMVELGIDEGCIVSMSSGAYHGNFGQTNYSAAKAGIVAMSRVWSKELARYNIRSAAIAPGTIETDMLRSMPPEALEGLAKKVPLGRIGDVDNIAQTVQFILENNYVSGDVIEVNGGLFF